MKILSEIACGTGHNNVSTFSQKFNKSECKNSQTRNRKLSSDFEIFQIKHYSKIFKLELIFSDSRKGNYKSYEKWNPAWFISLLRLVLRVTLGTVTSASHKMFKVTFLELGRALVHAHYILRECRWVCQNYFVLPD